MNTEADIKWIYQELDKVKNPAFIEAIKNMLKYRSKVSTERISIEQYNRKRRLESGITYTPKIVCAYLRHLREKKHDVFARRLR